MPEFGDETTRFEEVGDEGTVGVRVAEGAAPVPVPELEDVEAVGAAPEAEGDEVQAAEPDDEGLDPADTEGVEFIAGGVGADGLVTVGVEKIEPGAVGGVCGVGVDGLVVAGVEEIEDGPGASALTGPTAAASGFTGGVEAASEVVPRVSGGLAAVAGSAPFGFATLPGWSDAGASPRGR